MTVDGDYLSEREITDPEVILPSKITRACSLGCDKRSWIIGNDPSAGSPTETLLRLHLPLNSEV